MHIGVDETGKGPVLDPMVATVVRGDPDALPDGVTDSKRLVPEWHEELTARLRKHDGISVSVAFVKPETIDDPETGMNLLTVRAQVETATEITVDADELVCDADDMSKSRFDHRVRKGLAKAGVSVAVRVRHRMDNEHIIVGAASIVAKVERGRRVGVTADEYGEVGSDYPSSGTIREFLREYVRDYGIPSDCARKSWSTCAGPVTAHK